MIFHLTVIVVLLLHQLDINRQREEVFVMDFTRQEDLERQQKELEEQLEELKKKEDILKKIEEELAANVPSTTSEVKNLAVNTGKPLKDDRGTDADQLYKDAAELDAALKNGQKSAIQEDAQDETVELPGKGDKKKEAKEYSGPSVLSYNLDGRKANHLPIPAYRCYGGGQVTVIIFVNRNGAGAVNKTDLFICFIVDNFTTGTHIFPFVGSRRLIAIALQHKVTTFIICCFHRPIAIAVSRIIPNDRSVIRVEVELDRLGI